MTSPTSVSRRRLHRALWLILAILIVVIIGFVGWALTPWGAPMPETVSALESGDGVFVERDRWLVFRPADAEPLAGLAFYPGAKVLAESYAPWARQLAERGHLVALLPVPLNLALLDMGAAADVIAAYPGVDVWAVGGHSLGGVAAANFARTHEAVSGLLLMASLPADGDNLTGRDELAVSVVFASNDGLFTVEDVARARELLPEDTRYAEIVGGNHAQFGWYGPQQGDGPADISRAEQQAQIVNAIADLLDDISR